MGPCREGACRGSHGMAHKSAHAGIDRRWSEDVNRQIHRLQYESEK